MDEVCGVCAIGGLIAVFLVSIIGLALYVLGAFGFYRMAVNRDIDLAWLAFIPIAQLYVIGLIIGRVEYSGQKFEGQNLGLLLLGVFLGGGFLLTIFSSIPVLNFLLAPLISLALLAAYVLLVYIIFDLYSDNAILYTVLGVVTGIAFPILVFMIRENPQTPKEYYGV